MLILSEDMKVYIYTGDVDMRKSIDGLTVLVVEELKHNPQSKSLYLFKNKAKDKIKCVIWDDDGFILLYKRRERGKFKFPKGITTSYYEIDADLFNWLRKGFDFYELQNHPELKTSKYF